MISATELYRFFHAGDEETIALRGVSLEADASDIVAVVGPSGSGKSTLLACLAGLDDPDAGQVTVAGELMSRRPERVRAQLRARSIGVLSQSANLIEHLSIEGNLVLAQRLAGHNDAGRRDDLLTSLGLQRRARARPSQLSGGEAARAGLAVALANDPPVLLADEPTGELDGDTELELLALLRRCARSGTAIVVATHSPVVAAAATSTVTLVDGRVMS